MVCQVVKPSSKVIRFHPFFGISGDVQFAESFQRPSNTTKSGFQRAFSLSRAGFEIFSTAEIPESVGWQLSSNISTGSVAVDEDNHSRLALATKDDQRFSLEGLSVWSQVESYYIAFRSQGYWSSQRRASCKKLCGRSRLKLL